MAEQVQPKNLSGGAAILARLKAQRQQGSKSQPQPQTPAADAAAPVKSSPVPQSQGINDTAQKAAAETGGGLSATAEEKKAGDTPSTNSHTPKQDDQGPVLTGSAALLARLRKQKDEANQEKSSQGLPITIMYASQTGTAEEIARTIHSGCKEHNLTSKLYSMNELGFEGLSAEKTPLVVIVASSTGDGDPPENSGKMWVQLRKCKEQQRLAGIRYVVLGLGDSNYTRFMHVPRVFKNKFGELGGKPFYQYKEADEVDGLEEIVDTWIEELWAPLKARAEGQEESSDTQATAAKEQGNGQAPASADRMAQKSDAVLAMDAPIGIGQGLARIRELRAPEEMEGVPALVDCRVKVVFVDGEAEVQQVRYQEQSFPSAEARAYRVEDGAYDAQHPYVAKVVESKYLTSESSQRRVLHLGIDLGDSGIKYQPGDSIGILPQNKVQLVNQLLGRLDLFAKSDSVLRIEAADGSGSNLLAHLNWPCTVRSAFLRGVDITSVPRKSLLRILAEYCTNSNDKTKLLFLCSRGGRDIYKRMVEAGQPTLVDLLYAFPSCHVPLERLLDSLPALAPRMYSLTCSPMQSPQTVEVALSVVDEPSPFGKKEGVATCWLEKATGCVRNEESKEEALVQIFQRSGGAFGPPGDLSVPIIMIGPGTGVAPFRGFLQDRRCKSKGFEGEVGESWLFFGCRRREDDYIYQEDLEQLAAEGVLTHLHVAFSREQEEKVYVQHLMKQKAKELAALITVKGAYVYVCGDGAHMAKDVHATLVHDILVAHAGMAEKEAQSYTQDMTQQKRYVRDIWS